MIAEAGPSALATFTVNRNATLTLITRTATGQAATCWVTSTGNKLYASNAGSASVSGYTDRDGTLTALGNTAPTRAPSTPPPRPTGGSSTCRPARNGIVDEFAIGADGALTPIGSVTVPGGAGGEGIVAS